MRFRAACGWKPTRTYRAGKHWSGSFCTANSKKYNRLLERTLRDAEMLCGVAFTRYGFAYPYERLTEI